MSCFSAYVHVVSPKTVMYNINPSFKIHLGDVFLHTYLCPRPPRNQSSSKLPVIFSCKTTPPPPWWSTKGRALEKSHCQYGWKQEEQRRRGRTRMEAHLARTSALC